MTTLCIVDMQATFGAYEHCLDEVCHQVKLAKRRNAGIIVIEYRGSGPTVAPIKDLLKYYRKKVYTKKNANGGGSELLAAAKRKGFPVNKVRFTGVNRSWCVFSTIVQYQNLSGGGKIEIATRATWCGDPKGGMKLFRNLNARLI